MQGSGACWPGPQGLAAAAAEMLERRREQEVKNLARRKSTGESGGIQAPGACGPGLQGAWGPGPRAWGPAHQGPPHQTSNYDFSQTSWWEPGEGVGVG